jgi:hypothetical protein
MDIKLLFNDNLYNEYEEQIKDELNKHGSEYFDNCIKKYEDDVDLYDNLEFKTELTRINDQYIKNNIEENIEYILKTSSNYYKYLLNKSKYIKQILKHPYFCTNIKHLKNVIPLFEHINLDNALYWNYTIGTFNKLFFTKICFYYLENPKLITKIINYLVTNCYNRVVTYFNNLKIFSADIPNKNTINFNDRTYHNLFSIFSYIVDNLNSDNINQDLNIELYKNFTTYISCTLIYVNFIKQNCTSDIEILDKSIDTLNIKMSVIENENDFNLLSMETIELYQSKTKFETNLKKLNCFLNKYKYLNEKILVIINYLIKDCINKLITDENHINKILNLVQNIIYFFNIDLSDEKNIMFKKIIYELFDNKITKNYHLKKIFINIIKNNFINDHVIVDKLINYYIDLEKFLIPKEKLEYRFCITEALKLTNQETYNLINSNLLEKFIINIFNDNNMINETLPPIYQHIGTLLGFTYIKQFERYINIIENNYKIFNKIYKTNEEIINNSYLYDLIGLSIFLFLDICKSFDHMTLLNNNINIFNLKKSTFLEFISLIENKNVIKTIKNKDYKKLINFYVDQYKNLAFDSQSIIDKFDNLNNDQEISIPDKYLDPLLFTLIKEPLLIPNSDIFIDKETIKRHLLESETNPFTREPLTYDKLIEYNNEANIKKQLDVFKEELKKYN